MLSGHSDASGNSIWSINLVYLLYLDVEIYLVEHILTRSPVEEHGNVK